MTTLDLITEATGFLASLIAFILFLPQARRTWQVRSDAHALAGVSTGTQWLLLANAVLWGGYAVLAEAFWVGAPGLVNAPLAIATLLLISRGRTQARNLDPNPCVLCADGVDHQVFITAPPGWGSLMPCSPTSRRHGVTVSSKEDVLHLRASRR